MTDKSKTGWPRLHRHFRKNMISGMLVLIPVGITLLVMRWILQWMAGFLHPFVEKLATDLTNSFDMDISLQVLQAPLMIISIIGFLLAVYLTGALAQAMLGRRLIRAGETMLMRVPLASTIYSAAKQVMEAIAAPTHSALRTVVLVQFPRQGAWSIGFLTGRLNEAEGKGMLKLFIPTTPNPTTGFFVIVPQEDVLTTNMTVEEAFKMIISGGIVSPKGLEEYLSAKSVHSLTRQC